MRKVLSLAFILVISSCTKTDNSKKDQVERIAVLSPSSAQTIIDIGLEDKIACIAGPFDKLSLSKKVSSLGYYHNPSIERIIECEPDIIIASYAGTPPALYHRLKRLGYEMILEKPENISSIKEFIIELSDKFKQDSPSIVESFDSICIDKEKKDAVLLVGLNPVIAAGDKSFLSSALECAGFNNLIEGNYPRINLELLIDIKPDIVLLAFNSPENIKDYKTLKSVFGEKLIVIKPENLLEPSTRILKGIEELKLIRTQNN